MSSTVRAGVGACDHPREQVPGGEEVDVNQLVQCEVRGGDCVERREVHQRQAAEVRDEKQQRVQFDVRVLGVPSQRVEGVWSSTP